MNWLGQRPARAAKETGQSGMAIRDALRHGLAFCVALLYNVPQTSHIAPVFMTQVIVNQADLR